MDWNQMAETVLVFAGFYGAFLLGRNQQYIVNHCQWHGLWRTPANMPTQPCPKCRRDGV